MKIKQFWDVFESCGDTLCSKGFEFTGKSWASVSDQYKLSFEAPSDRFGRAFQVRHLTLCLAHKGIPGPDEPEPWLSDLLDGNCPVQISPALLLKFKSARFKKRVWHYGLPYPKNRLNLACYKPVYYGGESNWILKDRSAPEAENRRALLESLGHLGIDYVSEQTCSHHISSAANAVASAGKFWAESLSPSSVLSQLQRYGSDWWVEKEWIRGYQQYNV